MKHLKRFKDIDVKETIDYLVFKHMEDSVSKISIVNTGFVDIPFVFTSIRSFDFISQKDENKYHILGSTIYNRDPNQGHDITFPQSDRYKEAKIGHNTIAYSFVVDDYHVYKESYNKLSKDLAKHTILVANNYVEHLNRGSFLFIYENEEATKYYEDSSFSSEVKDIYHDSIEYGYRYDSVIKDIKKIDFLRASDLVEGSNLFHLMALIKSYECVEYIDFRTSYFMNSSASYNNLGFHIMKPFFTHCLENTELFWETEDIEMCILYMIFDPKLMDTIDGSSDIQFYFDMIVESLGGLMESLVLYNRKDSMQILVNKIKQNSISPENKKILLGIQGKLLINRVRDNFTRQRYIYKGTFIEEPDYDFFLQKVKEIEELGK